MVGNHRLSVAAIAAVYLAAHLPFLAPSLEDIDSINFALGLRHFDPALYQPHPPGYPIFILLGHLSLALVHATSWLTGQAAEAWALSVWSAIGGALCLVAAASLFAAVGGRLRASDAGPGDEPDSAGGPQSSVVWATLLLGAAPLFWVTGLRPMSDMIGLASATASQALMLQRGGQIEGRVSFGSANTLLLGALLAGLATGIRVQIAVLTLPVLAWVILVEPMEIGATRTSQCIAALGAFAAGCLAWGIPLLVMSGGISRYMAALGSQGTSDFTGVDMLWSNPTPRHAAVALYQTLVLPWASVPLAATIGIAAAAGVIVMLVRNRRGLALLAVAYAPYLAFHLLLQETITVRYALPMLVPIAWFAASGIAALRRFAPFVAVPVVASALIVAVPDGVAYGRDPHPAFRAIADAVRRAGVQPPGAVFSHDAIVRPLQAASTPGLHAAPPAPLHYEWLAAVDYWRHGGTAPVWFFADRRRTDLALIDPQARTDVVRYRWSVEDRPELSGTRPLGVDWYRLPVPGWAAGTGWSLTPETGGITQASAAGPDHRPIEAYVRRRSGPFHAVIGGRHLGDPGDADAEVAASIDGREIDRWTLRYSERNFLRFIRLPDGIDGAGAFATVTIQSHSIDPKRAAPVAIRQFDMQPASRLIWGYGAGWHEAEFTAEAGLQWRWTSERSVLRIDGAERGVRLTLRGESPLRYFKQPPTVTITAGGTTIARFTPDADFNWDVMVPADALARSAGEIAIETDRVYLPAKEEGSADDRHLGLRIFDLRVNPVLP